MKNLEDAEAELQRLRQNQVTQQEALVILSTYGLENEEAYQNALEHYMNADPMDGEESYEVMAGLLPKLWRLAHPA